MKTKEEIKISESSEAKDDLFEGEQLNRIVSTLKKETDKIGLIEETKRISKRVKFKRDVGLVLGQVQSGKTTSFEAVTAMLTDNKLPLTIILGGVSIVLTTQNRERVFKHFTNDGKERDWFIEDTLNGLPGNFRTNLKNNLTRWNSAARNKKSSVIVCMKDHSHISKLTKELEKLEPILEETKVLIIDDEADQYSMNTRPNINPGDKNDPSTTYSEIQSLRKCLPNHTYLQYTATPQAPFLISTMDRLSPHWVDRVTPGEDYIGFDELFKQDADGVGAHVRYVEPTLDNDTEEMPESLKSAMGSFLVASAQLSLEKNDNTVEEDSRIKFDVLSMLVHPSRKILTQEAMHDFIKTTWEDWKDATEEPDRFENNYEEFKNIIRKQWDDYAFYSPQRLKPLEEILEEIEVNVIGDIGIELINSGKRRTSETIDYSKNDFFIVISGQAMDRGTTVEGLITTYLSRGASVQEDTQIQRARFCGYKRNFMDFIRIYLDSGSNERFKNYGITNADFMDLIDDCNSKDMSFKDVRREWRINAGANSCRKNVVSLEGAVVLKGKKVSKWSYPVRPHRSDFEFNNNVIENFLSKHELEKSPDSGNGEFTSHAEITLPFEDKEIPYEFDE